MSLIITSVETDCSSWAQVRKIQWRRSFFWFSLFLDVQWWVEIATITKVLEVLGSQNGCCSNPGCWTDKIAFLINELLIEFLLFRSTVPCLKKIPIGIVVNWYSPKREWYYDVINCLIFYYFVFRTKSFTLKMNWKSNPGNWSYFRNRTARFRRTQGVIFWREFKLRKRILKRFDDHHDVIRRKFYWFH